MAGLSSNVGGWLHGWGGARSPGFKAISPRPVRGGSGERLVSGIAQPPGLRLGFHGGPARPSAPSAYPATPAAAAPASAPAPTPAAAPPAFPSPYDSQYFADLGVATDKANQQIAGFNQNIANGQTNLQTAIGQLAKKQVAQSTNAQNAENARGGFAQGALGHTLGQIGQNTLDTQNADTLRFGQNKAAWESAIAGVQQGLSLEQIALAAASAGRQAALGIEAPAGTPGAPAPGASGGAPAVHAPAGHAAPSRGGPRPLSVTPQPRSSHPAPKRGGRPMRAGRAATFLY